MKSVRWIHAPWLVPRGFKGYAFWPSTVVSKYSFDEATDGHYWHEWTHAVKQGGRYGPFYLPVYLYHVVRLWVTGKDVRKAHPMELEAIYWAKIAITERWTR